MSSIFNLIKDVDGWLGGNCADLTERILASQGAGPILEFGVHRGKYLALLYGASAHTNDLVVGVDAFFAKNNVPMPIDDHPYPRSVIENNIRLLCPDLRRLKIVAANTMTLSVDDVMAFAGAPYRFMSIDGGHDAETVQRDLEIAVPNLAHGGVIAMDDAFNAVTPGVAEGVCRYLSINNSVASFATCEGKLFLTTPQHHEGWLSFCTQLLKAETPPYLKTSKERLANNSRIGFVPEFFGHTIIPFYN